jgi:hypothetical protein
VAGFVEAGVAVRCGEEAPHALAELEAEMLRDEPAARLDSSRRRLDDDEAVDVVDPVDRPGSPSQQERRHPLDEAVHEVLFQGAEVAAGRVTAR